MSEEVSGTWRQAVILPDGMNLNQELVKQGWCSGVGGIGNTLHWIRSWND
jgi:hypothetical protein